MLYTCILRTVIFSLEGAIKYDGPNGSLFISILLHNSEFRNLHCKILEFGIRNCEVYVVWASGTS